MYNMISLIWYFDSTSEKIIKSPDSAVLVMEFDGTRPPISCLNFKDIAHVASELEPTKRHLISIIVRFYDPMGFLSPVVIKFKILFQALCEERQDWDQLLTGDLLQRWKTLISELRSSPAMSMLRCLLDGVPGEVNSFSLHGFCDASKHAYAAVLYLVIKTPNGRFTRFVASNTTRVSPLKSQTIP